MSKRQMYQLMNSTDGEGSDLPGGESAPVETITPETTESSDINWDALAEDGPDDVEGEGEATPAESEVTPAPTPTPAPAPVAPATPATTQPQQPVVPPVVPPTEPVVPPVAPTPAPVTPEVVPQQTPPEPAPAPVDMVAQRAKYVETLEQSYQLSDEEAIAATAEPEKVLPKLAATLHARVVEETVNMIFSNLPQFVNQVIETTSNNRAVEDKFFGQWPALKEAKNDPVKSQQILNTIKVWRSMNPKADLDTTIREAGIHAMISLRLPIDGALLNGGQATPTPAPAPAYTPAAPGAGSTGGLPIPKSTNPYEILAEEFIEDDRN